MTASLDFPVATDDLQENLLTALRAELEEYGGLLALFEAQQDAILDRDAGHVLALSTQIEEQAQATRRRRKLREGLIETLALTIGRPECCSLRELTPLFREPLRPLVEALTSEVNRLIGHTRRRARQNQMLLARAVEITGELVARFSSETVNRTYSARGLVRMNHTARPSRLLDRS